MSVMNPTEKMKPVFDEVCRFKVGDLVVLRSLLEEWRVAADLNKGTIWDRVKMPHLGVVTGRKVEECHGGLQVHYQVRTETSLGFYEEFALEPSAEIERTVRSLRSEKAP